MVQGSLIHRNLVDNTPLRSLSPLYAGRSCLSPSFVTPGLHGKVYSVQGGRERRALMASVKVTGQGLVVKSDTAGQYYRPLAPGSYSVTVEAPDHSPATVLAEVPGSGQGLSLDIELKSLLPPITSAQAKPSNSGLSGATTSSEEGSTELVVTEDEDGLLRGGSLSGLHVMAYVLGLPLLGGLVFVIWSRSFGQVGGSSGRKVVDPWYSTINLPTRSNPVTSV